MARPFAIAGIVLLVLFLSLSTGAALAAPVVQQGCSDQPVLLDVPATGVLTLKSGATQTAWFELAERGHLLTVSSDNATVSRIGMPYRRGLHAAALPATQSIRIARASTTPARVQLAVSVDCSQDTAAVAHQRWIQSLATAAAPLQAMLTAEQATPLLARIDQLLASAAGPNDQALALHVKAQALLLASRTADSAAAFAVAEQHWTAVGDSARARVARVARVEDLQRLARHDEALALADGVPADLAQTDYFAARLRLSRCLTLRYQGRMADALACFRERIGAMERLGETLDLVSGLQDMADVSRFMGDFATARRIGKQALEKCSLPNMEVQRGRIEIMLADIALEMGDLPQALAGFDGALTEFAAARAPRWEANALLRTADLYVALGGLEEASDFVAAALQRLSERDAPARVAAARFTQARIDMLAGRPDRARSALASITETYTRLAMPADRDGVELASANLALQSGDAAQAGQIAARRDRSQAINQGNWSLVDAGVAAATGSCAKALGILRELDRQPRSLSMELERVQIRAECLAGAGKVAEAEKSLLDSARRIATLARQVDSPLLRQMLGSYIAPLRRSAFRLVAAANDGVPGTPAAIWQWLHLDDDAVATAQSPSMAVEASRFDAEVARELLSSDTSEPARSKEDGPRHLLTMLAARSGSKAAAVAGAADTTLAQLQQRLGDAVMVSYVDAGKHSMLLWISRDSAHLQPTSDIASLTAAADQLTASISLQTTPLATITVDSARLSALLWPVATTQPGAAPVVLMIDAASPLAGLPWSVLSWPGSETPLLDTTRVTLARLGAVPVAAAANRNDVSVFIAGQEASAELATLWNARSEPGLIENGLREHGGRVTSVAATDRNALIAAFAQAGSSLHIAAHGGVLPSRIGYAGIWLETSAVQPVPRFVSWMEILARGASNDLVVLNACQLAERPDASAAGMSFADAVSRAGARDVVAARWQVSDGATTLWVPVFYRQRSEGDSAATALWTAQRRLRDSRVFRHPFYWASYVHFERI